MRLLLNWSERCGSQKLIDGQCAEGLELRIAGAATTSQARIVEVRFAPDSLLEEEGLEPSVPVAWATLSRTFFCLCGIFRSARDRGLARGTEGSNPSSSTGESRANLTSWMRREKICQAGDAPSERWRSGWDGEFESPLLQRRVRKLSVPA
jgi:hypothetical protein